MSLISVRPRVGPPSFEVVGKRIKPPDFQSGDHGFKSRLPYHPRVAQLEERFATNEKAWRFESSHAAHFGDVF